jgi:hypothetical protein
MGIRMDDVETAERPGRATSKTAAPAQAPRQRPAPRRPAPEQLIPARVVPVRLAPGRSLAETLAPDRYPPEAEPERLAPDRHAPERVAPDRVAPDRHAPDRVGSGRPAAVTHARGRAAQRMPFVVLLCGLLGGALVSLLVISTTLAAGSFRITSLQQQEADLARQRQELQQQVAEEQSAQSIAERAYQLGMRPVGELRFIDLKNHKVLTDAASGADALINVPGYTP